MTIHPGAAGVAAAVESREREGRGGDDREHRALRERALILDRSARGRLRISGPRAAEFVTGIVTNDVSALAPGAGLYACALTPKGRIVADLRIYAEAEALLLDSPERATPGWVELVRKYINPRFAPYEDVGQQLRHFGVFGPAAARVVAAACQVDEDAVAALEPYAHMSPADAERSHLVARSPELRLDGFDLFVEQDAAADTWQRALDAGAERGTGDAWEIARVEAGRPEWGLDMDESTLPQEANMDVLGAISYTKGCYVGQEVVARIHFRGHVNRHLRGLRFGHPDGAPTGSQLFAVDGKALGDVRSSVRSPTLGAIALAMVRREAATNDEIVARGEFGDVGAIVTGLPFPE